MYGEKDPIRIMFENSKTYLPYTPTCDLYMKNYCSKSGNKDDIACGCQNFLPNYDCTKVDITKDKNCLAKIVYDTALSNNLNANPVCLMPRCNNQTAYKFPKDRGVECPSMCLNIMNIVADKYSQVIADGVRMTMNCQSKSDNTYTPSVNINTIDSIPTSSMPSSSPSAPPPPPPSPLPPPPSDQGQQTEESGGVTTYVNTKFGTDLSTAAVVLLIIFLVIIISAILFGVALIIYKIFKK